MLMMKETKPNQMRSVRVVKLSAWFKLNMFINDCLVSNLILSMGFYV
jgi:hypothetical protein